MNDEQKIQEELEHYLDGAMSAEERRAFEARLRSDPALAEALALERAARAVVTTAGRESLRDRLEGFEQEWQNSMPSGKRVRLHLLRRVLLAAAILLMAVAAIWLFQKPSSPPDLFAAYFEPYRAPVAGRGAMEDVSAFERAGAAYAGGDYDDAAELFRASLGDSTTVHYLAEFYLGLSLLAQTPPRAEDAILAFDEVLAVDNDYREQAMWYKGLALLKLGRKEEAKEMLGKETKGFKRKERKELLKLVNDE